MKIKFNHEKAREYIEGFGKGESAEDHEKLQAWAYMIKTGYCWQIRPLWIGRAAKALIKNGVINEAGEIIHKQKVLKNDTGSDKTKS